MEASIDRFEGYYAVLLVGEKEDVIDWPKSLLPMGASEGDVITINIAIDREETQAGKKRVESLLEKLKKKNQGK
ncbi:DUF3006 domain-containing protein [Heliorestis acidaminivorans]|uniref:DUF3006 domain-containing protein n=1 Tax=Heliorestis acidaminivorans TaxID=553427 RepID=A0A6I0EPY3_9FIRM|nr:DUF3006 domain-containing protein [Heliorestis acidaminivorans]